MAKIFANISENNKCKLLKIMEANTYTFKENEEISNTLHNNNTIGIIISGLIEMQKIDYEGNKSLVDEFMEDDMFGYMFNPIANNNLEILVKEEATIIFIDYQEILNCSLDKYYYTQFLKNILIAINQKLQERNERLEILTNKSIRNKLLAYLRIMAKKHGTKYVYLPFNFTDLANYLVIDRSAMSREIGYLKAEGFIEIKGKRITLLYDIG